MADTASETRSLKIGTHDGKFHCDEALACFILKELPRFADAQIVRTRDAKQHAVCDVVVDVGGEYDPARMRFDHHQSSFTHTMASLEPARFGKLPHIKLSSAGLIWYHFGLELVNRVLSNLDTYRTRFSRGLTRNYLPQFATETQPRAELVYNRIYETFMLELDAIDNGVNECDCAATTKRYHVSTGLSSRVGHLNSCWNEEATVEIQNERFVEAMKLAGGELISRIIGLVDVWWPSRAIIEEAYERRFEVDPSGAIMQLSRGGCPWKEHLTALEEETATADRVLFVTYPEDSRMQDGARCNWRVQAVPVDEGSFESRLPLATAWRGLREAQLSEVVGIPDCVFIHASGFIGGHRNAAGAIELARRTMALAGVGQKSANSEGDGVKNGKRRTDGEEASQTEANDAQPQAKRGTN